MTKVMIIDFAQISSMGLAGVLFTSLISAFEVFSFLGDKMAQMYPC